jgi:8-oxo-dGTP pyrophosphatase MutT (NUDIX family)
VALDLGAIERAVRRLDDPPAAPGWNHAELADVLGPGPRTPAAVLVPLVARPDGVSLILTLRNAGLRTHAGQVSFPGGRVEADDADAVAAAVRETREETGIAPSLVRPFGFLDAFETISGFCVTPVVGEVARDYALAPDPAEVDDVFEVPLAFLLDPRNLQRRQIDWQGRARDIFEYQHSGRRIWGATAAMLVNLQRRLERIA